MPAHLRLLPRCDWFGCDRPAVEELRNTFNAPCGVYCARHANKALSDFQKAERRE